MKTIFDIETGPDPKAECPPFDPAEVKTGNIKDPEKIKSKLIEAEQEHYRKFQEKAALSPYNGEVLCVGVLRDGVYTCIHGDEPSILESFWQCFHESSEYFFGWNIKEFDLPFLVHRSWHHQIKPPGQVREGRYWASRFVDVREEFHFHIRNQPGTLDYVAKFLGLPGKIGEGKDFAFKWEHAREFAIEYNREELDTISAVMGVMGL